MLQYPNDLQNEINKIEFESFANKKPTISEVAFAELLLSYADLKDEGDFVQRARSRENQKVCVMPLGCTFSFKHLLTCFASIVQQPVSFQQFQAFNNFLKNIDDVEMALGMYTAAGASITKGVFVILVALRQHSLLCML